jgi:hemin uptake protein HemP
MTPPANTFNQGNSKSATTTRSRVDSTYLLGGAGAVEIQHAGQTYLLRVTRENKLILTK